VGMPSLRTHSMTTCSETPKDSAICMRLRYM
jgi:hypothetical protein